MKIQKTNQLKRAYIDYGKSEAYSLYGIYQNFSEAKARAWAYCENLCKKFGGHSLKAITGNSFTFSAGFTFKNENDEEIFCFITPAYNRFYKIEN